MRDFQWPGRSPAMAGEAMAATSHPLGTATAIDVLRRGGNAVDAAIAAAATLAVVEPHMTGIGGDCFALLWSGKTTGDVVALNGSGAAPAAATVDWYLAHGVRTIPDTSPHAVTVPGAVAAWWQVHQDFGRLDWPLLFADAIRHAEDGYPVTARVAHDWHREEARLRADANCRAVFLSEGRAPAAGDRHRQPALAETLRHIARKGRHGFYAGPVAADMVAALRALGGQHTAEDFAGAAPRYDRPIHAPYRGYDIYECPPNGRGIAALMMLRLLAGYDLSAFDPLGVERLHLQGEATKLAFEVADALVCDPQFVRVPVAHLLSDAFAVERRALIGGHARDAAPFPEIPPHPDTVYLAVVDRDRMAVSFINSLYWAFGSGIVAPGSGVLLHNRGMSFRIDPDHPNRIEPGKRPMHTILPAMALRDGRPDLVFGVMGGDYQPVGQVQVLTNILDYGMDVQQAIDLPRSFAAGGTYRVESGIPAATVAGLTARGHAVRPADEPLGGGQAIRIDWDRGLLTGGSDPRKDGIALGY
jgi:gamma-glutamyltranspeptidase/glutathione hydrolase